MLVGKKRLVNPLTHPRNGARRHRDNAAPAHERAGGGGRTRDLPLTRRLLCQLSYASGHEPGHAPVDRLQA